jgi:hypothetical protein
VIFLRKECILLLFFFARLQNGFWLWLYHSGIEQSMKPLFAECWPVIPLSECYHVKLACRGHPKPSFYPDDYIPLHPITTMRPEQYEESKSPLRLPL